MPLMMPGWPEKYDLGILRAVGREARRLELSQKYADVSGRSRVNLQRYNPQLAGECRVSFCRVRHPVFRKQRC